MAPPHLKQSFDLKSQYADLCEDEDDCDDDAITVETPSPVVGDEVHQPGADVEGDSMEVGDVIENSWFPPNNNSKRHRRQDDVLNHSGSETDEIVAQAKKKKQKPSSIPVNKTLLSNGAGATVLVAQDLHNRDAFLGASSKKFTLDPMNLSRGLKDLLDYSHVKDVRLNPRRNIVAIEFLEAHCADIAPFLLVQTIGPFAVRCYLPAADVGDICWGVIGGIHEEVDIAEMLKSIKCEGCSAVQAVRLHKFVSGKKEVSRAVKIGFSGNTVPNGLTIDFLHYPVRPFEQPPLRCYRCQRPGHLASGCTAKLRCLVCGGPHQKDDCTATLPQCANCLGPHVASSRDCRFNKDALRVQSLVRGGMSFRGARQHVIRESQQTTSPSSSSPALAPGTQQLLSQQEHNVSGTSPPTSSALPVIDVVADVHQSQGSYIIPRRFPRQPLHYAAALSPPPTPEAPPEAPPASAVLAQCQAAVSASMESLFTKLSAFLVEVFSLNLLEEGKRERKMLLIGLIRNHFGGTYSDPLLKQQQQQKKQQQQQKQPQASASTVKSSSPVVAGKKLPPSQPSSTGSQAASVPAASQPGSCLQGKKPSAAPTNVRSSTRKKK